MQGAVNSLLPGEAGIEAEDGEGYGGRSFGDRVFGNPLGKGTIQDPPTKQPLCPANTETPGAVGKPGPSHETVLHSTSGQIFTVHLTLGLGQRQWSWLCRSGGAALGCFAAQGAVAQEQAVTSSEGVSTRLGPLRTAHVACWWLCVCISCYCRQPRVMKDAHPSLRRYGLRDRINP